MTASASTARSESSQTEATSVQPYIERLIGARDPRLDFFRGLAMAIILIAHTPNNAWALWIPARFGWSDATEIFVFCSGMASAIAFGKVFARRGIAMGALRVLFRLWQVYWAHLGLFFVIAATLTAIDFSPRFGDNYAYSLNLVRFFDDAPRNLLGLMTLTYVPNYFDVLPMYIVALALMPLVVALARWHVAAAAALVIGLWGLAQAGYLDLPAEPWSTREWFFNPFGWQLIFYTGFAFMAGWLPKPKPDNRLIVLAISFLAVSAVLAYDWGRTFPDPDEAMLTPLQSSLRALHEMTLQLRIDNQMLIGKTDFAILRYVHFLAIAYLAWIAVGPKGERLKPQGSGAEARAKAVALAAILKVGQQSLAIFVFSMWYALIQGVILDQIGRTAATVAFVNVTGLLMLVAVAHIVGYIKTHPWRDRGPAR